MPSLSTATITRFRRLILAALVALFCGRIALTYRVFNDTFDEAGHIRGGLEILQRGSYPLGDHHPPLGRLILATPPYLAGLRLDHHGDLWGGGPWTRREPEFFWKTLLLARAANLLFAGLLLFFVYRWASVLYGAPAGLAAGLLAICCPNLVAHASLATLDLPATATFLMAAYFLWRWSRQPGWRYCLATAAAFALATLAKLGALFHVPLLGLMFFLLARRGRLRLTPAALRTGLARGAAFAMLAGFLVWAGYLFNVDIIVPPGHRYISAFDMGGPDSPPNRLLKALGHRRLPAPGLAQGVIELLSHNQAGHRAYLLGRLAQHGWWYYFPAALAVKTSLPLLVLTGIVLWLLARGRLAGAARDSIFPLLAILVTLAVGMAGNLNIGIRHVLPVYALLAILASGVFAAADRFPARPRTLVAAALGLMLWQAWESAAAHPDYLAYFNQLGRGREAQLLADSNLDWGQDLARLGDYVRQNRIDAMHLRYFGVSDPAKFGIPARELPPHQPRRGWVAISVNYLLGLANDPAEYAWLKARRPAARVGKSIWVYYIP